MVFEDMVLNFISQYPHVWQVAGSVSIHIYHTLRASRLMSVSPVLCSCAVFTCAGYVGQHIIHVD